MTPRQHQGPRGGGESRGSLVAPDEIHPRDDVPCHGLQELCLESVGWQGEGRVQGVEPEEGEMGGRGLL